MDLRENPKKNLVEDLVRRDRTTPADDRADDHAGNQEQNRDDDRPRVESPIKGYENPKDLVNRHVDDVNTRNAGI